MKSMTASFRFREASKGKTFVQMTVDFEPGMGVVGKLRRRRSLSTEEFVYLRGRTSRIPKVTLPSPGLFANFWPDAPPCSPATAASASPHC